MKTDNLVLLKSAPRLVHQHVVPVVGADNPAYSR